MTASARLPQSTLHKVALLRPDNRSYLEGKSNYVHTEANGCIVIFLSVFFFAGLFLITMVMREWYSYVLLQSQGVSVVGQFVSKEWDSDSDGDTFYVTYSYVVADRTYTNTESISRDQYASADNGEPLLLTYAAGDPTVSIIGKPDASMPLFMTLFMIFWCGLTWSMFFYMLRRWLLTKRLSRSGQVVVGEVTASDLSRDSDGDYSLTIHYRFTSPQTGAILVGKESATRNDLRTDKKKEEHTTSPLRFGTPVAILYAADREHVLL
jgi:hypothetical protein